MILKLCLGGCGRVTSGSRCPACRRVRIRAYDAGRPAAALYGSAEWRRLAAATVAAASSCHWCGRSDVKLVADHREPVALRPDLALASANVVASCYGCNTRRGSTTGAPR